MGKLDRPYKIQTETRTKKDENGNSTSWTIPWDKCISTTKYGLLEGYHVDKFADEDAGNPKDNVWFVVVDSLGQQVNLEQLGSPIEVTLHRAEKATFLHEVDDNSSTDY
ncbi:hypothetical protein BDV38DRAFT_265930 [Aspergillus pseudotamarii]|uniref:Uncharacterized protein n=1 Tax=Aspergillus pseudotamarii TaxID=132259 RepID=A0A5N6SCS3_ASPPS|nr:uncharacterized protein BDV38DRAFT_265930 [Aspergillus pseudotamarii]KAE8130914.1 hypothetical protein BDV38DRAFT_265930 [Aspergillus pseudotamarii]